MIRLELRCRSARRACLLAVVRQDSERGLVADVTVRYAVMATPTTQQWTTDHYTAEIGDGYLLLGCRHVQGIAEHSDAIRQYVRDTPRGVRFLA